MIYQWTERGGRILIDGLHWRLATIFTLSTVYLNLWFHKQWLAAFFFAVALFGVVTNTYFIVKRWFPARNIYDERGSSLSLAV